MHQFALHVLQLPVRTGRSTAEALVVVGGVEAPNVNITAPRETCSAALYLHLLRAKLQNHVWTGWKHSQHLKKTRTDWGKLDMIIAGAIYLKKTAREAQLPLKCPKKKMCVKCVLMCLHFIV